MPCPNSATSTRAPSSTARYKCFAVASEFLHGDEWPDRAKFFHRARHAVPLLTSNVANTFSHCERTLLAACGTGTDMPVLPNTVAIFQFHHFPKELHMTASKTTIGYIVQLGGIGAFALGAVLSFHHAAIAASFAGGAAAFYVGQKIRALSSPATVSAPSAASKP